MDLQHTCRRCGCVLPDDGLRPTLCLVCGVATWAASEDPFRADGYCGQGPDGAVHAVAGDPRVIFSASSSVNYYRGSSRMPAARNTGSLAIVAAQSTGGMALAAAGQPVHLLDAQQPGVPEPGFVAALARAVEADSFVVDVRGMRDRAFDVCVGTGPLPDQRAYRVADAIAETCARRGLSVAVNEPFAALPAWTVSHYAQTALGVSALQVQLSASLRDPVRQDVHAHVCLTALRAAARAAQSDRP